MSLGLILILLSLAFSALFSGVEIAFVSANKLQIELDKSRNKISGKLLSWFNQRDSSFITMLLLGNNVALVIYGIYMEDMLSPLLSSYLPSFMNGYVAILFVNTIISTLIILIFAEFIPKATFRLNSNRALEIFSLPLIVFYVILWPFVWAFIKSSEIVLRYVFRIEMSTQKYQFTTTDLDHYIQEFHHDNSVESAEIESDLQIFRNAIEFRSTKIRECMVPRTEIQAIDQNENGERLIQIFQESGHSKILVYRDNIDNIIGYVHAYDVIKKSNVIIHILRDIVFIPETMAASVMLNRMIKEDINIAVVLDEFGGTSGLITMEDLMEEIFGEIEDEFDNDLLTEKVFENQTYIFSARLEIDYLNETYDLELEDTDDYKTLGGYITHHYESIPEKGTIITLDNHTFEIIQAGNTKIDLIKLVKND